MREAIAAELWRLVRDYAERNALEMIWEPPLAR